MEKPPAYSDNGLTFYICIGQFGGFGIEIGAEIIVMRLGWISFCLMAYDVEMVMVNLNEKIERLERGELD